MGYGLNLKDDFGAMGDGVSDDTVPIQNALDTGRLIFCPSGTYKTTQPLIGGVAGTRLVGENTKYNSGNSVILADFIHGPKLRIKSDSFVLENICFSSTSARRASTRITGQNYASLGLSRDQQNPGIWVEADDDSVSTTNFIRFFNVSSHNDSSDAFLFVGNTYGSKIEACYSVQTRGHAIVFDQGEYTNRTNLKQCGVLTLSEHTAIDCNGHGLVVGSPYTIGAPPLRIIVNNCDFSGSGYASSIMYQPYCVFFFADNSEINNSAVDGRSSTQGGIYCGGRNLKFNNNRYIRTNQPIKVDTNVGATERGTHAVDIWGMTATVAGSYVIQNAVDVADGAEQVRVYSGVSDGNYSNLATEQAAETQNYNNRVWNGYLTLDGADSFVKSKQFWSGSVSIQNNSVSTLTPRMYAGFLFVSVGNTSQTPDSGSYAIVYYDCGTTVSIVKVFGGSGIEVSNTNLNGTSGNLSRLTIGSPGGGTLQIENRLGSTKQIFYTFIG